MRTLKHLEGEAVKTAIGSLLKGKQGSVVMSGVDGDGGVKPDGVQGENAIISVVY